MPEPIVSFIIPTLNASAHLPACLTSIRNQSLPTEDVEILVADGGSTDGTRDLAVSFGARVLDNELKLAEAGKELAFREARGEFLALLDADNEIDSPHWLSTALRGLHRYPEALGFESYYLPHPSDSRLNHYLTALLQISDPYARSLAEPLEALKRDDDGVELFRLPASGGYPTGANGFVFHRRRLQEIESDIGYHEASFFPALMRAGRTHLVKAEGCGIYHHYVSGWSDYLAKRRYAMIIYMLRKQETPDTWDGRGIGWRKWRALAYHGTFLGPAIEGAARAIHHGDGNWLLHPIASAVSTVGNIAGICQYWLLGSQERRRRQAVLLHRHPKK
ncbi:MAG: glycosyltransferase family 2 protein [Deltaproteobacteria bacterium]|nr:glycosyltransferase family 2 protein [Deltaproteobacteria bacterium]